MFASTLIGMGLALMLFVGMVLASEVGRRMGKRRLIRDPEGARSGLTGVEGALFALLGLLVAFTFGGAATRFDQRRDLIVDEANAISTAWARLDLLADAPRTVLRDLFRRYLDERLTAYREIGNPPALAAARERANKLQGEIWQNAVQACRGEEGRATTVVLVPALNEMFDIATTRAAALQKHPPPVIFIMLFALALGCALLAGYSMAGGSSRSWMHTVGLALVTSVVVYVILDLEHPRFGLIRVEAFDQLLIDQREAMK